MMASSSKRSIGKAKEQAHKNAARKAFEAMLARDKKRRGKR